MRSFTDIFIRRPVLAMVVSLLLLVLGLRSVTSLPILQYPRTENAVVTVTTTYYGADPNLVAGFITTPLENAIAQANGIDYMTSASRSSVSVITATLRLNYDPNKAQTEIATKVSSVLNQLPSGAQQPVISVAIGETIAAMYIGFSSDVLAPNQITDYLVRVVQPKLQAVQGVQTAELLGANNFALRAWLDPQKMAAYGLTGTDINQALAQNDFLSALGTTKGQMVQVNLTASTSLHTVEEFRNLVVKQTNGAVVRLGDVANVTLGSDDYETSVGFDGQRAVYIGIKVAPAANLLDVIDGVRNVFPDIVSQLPQGLEGKIVYDSTKFVNSSINEVIMTLVEALLIVTFVVFLFLGSPRSVIIPVVAIPLSLIGTFVLMLAFGFSINLLTLLALVLAIGLVVDDAIIVVENVNRHLDEGMKPIPAALIAARELGGPIIAMTVVLVAVYVPLGFQGGLTGALFTEFAFTLVGAVTVSAIVALTLSPMMASRMLKPHQKGGRGWEARTVDFIDRTFDRVRRRYQRSLEKSLNYLSVSVVFALLVIPSIYFLYVYSQKDLAPQEDQGVVFTFATSAPNSTLQQRQLYSEQVFQRFSKYPEMDHVFQLDLPGQSIAGMVLKPWDQRSRSATQVQNMLQMDLGGIAGARLAIFQPPSLPGASGFPVQFVIGTTEAFPRLNEVARGLMGEALQSGLFVFLDSDLKIDQPQVTVVIDRDKTAQLGLKMSDVGSALASMLGGGYVNYFSIDGRSYKVIPQVQQRWRLNADQVLNYYIRTADGTPVPLSTVAKVVTETVPQSLNHFQQLNSATIQGVVAPGITLGDAITRLQEIASRTLPPGYSVDYGGPSRQYIQESSGFMITLALAVILIFLALAALFESFRDPVIILLSVPMSIAGAMIFINLGLGGATWNIYTQVGLFTLGGLISKHGILIVEFANDLRKKGMDKRRAIEEATSIRLRPILMTTAAMALGVVPLLLAGGAGAVSRFAMGLVIFTGITIGTLFTLYVVPAAYMIISSNRSMVEDDKDETALPLPAADGTPPPLRA